MKVLIVLLLLGACERIPSHDHEPSETTFVDMDGGSVAVMEVDGSPIVWVDDAASEEAPCPTR